MYVQILNSRLYHGVCCFVLFFVAASASFNGFYEACHFHEISAGWEEGSFERMLEGTADRPYVYRRLLPDTANWIGQVVPQTIQVRLYNRQVSRPDSLPSPTANNRVYFFRYFVTYIATFLFSLVAVYAMYFVCKDIGMSPPAAVFAPVIVILLLPYITSYSGFNYDYSELAFIALAVWVTLKFDWWWAIPVAALGTWNKESFLLFIPALYPLIRRRTSRLGALLAIAVLCSVCAAVYFPIRLRFAHNPGSTVIVQWLDQLRYFTHPLLLLFATEPSYGMRVPKAFSLIPMALLSWIMVRSWRHLPLFIRRHGQIAAAINIPLYVLFCSPGEVRDLSMLYIVLLLALAVNLNEWIGASKRARPQQESERAADLSFSGSIQTETPLVSMKKHNLS